MTTKDVRIDKYIANSADFAKPILNHLRELVHKACPETKEKIKWGFPHFDYKGMMCSMAAFKQHCAFGFWKASLMKDKKLIANDKSESAMEHLGRITSLKDLPSDKVLISYISEAKQLNDDGAKLSLKTTKNEKGELAVLDYFLKVLKKNKVAFKIFENFSPSHKREYIEWIIEAKTEETRSKRIITVIEWLSAGKTRNWKYMKK
jgi:uncharacterized protein YdeI (YjbR/CyaY-like superfamily)